MMGAIKMTLNIIITPIIITHAQGFECITKFFGEGYLAAPYSAVCNYWIVTQLPVQRNKGSNVLRNNFMVTTDKWRSDRIRI